ncbi:hypothetical protein [Parafrankia sp. FMc2]|uniref:hypothetical protein n=1 Tax=Parafrankia sp. FMc2 TaxID=3233196 RepID=UPI0034D79326
MADLLRDRTTILIALSALVALVLVAVFARWFSRTRGWRRTFARHRRQFLGGFRDLAALAAARHRFRRDVRDIAALLADRTLASDTAAALTAVGAARTAAGGEATPTTGPDAITVPGMPAIAAGTAVWPFQATVRTGSVRVHLAGRGLDPAARIRTSPRPGAPRPATAEPIGDPARWPCPVAVGLLPGTRGALVLLDLAALPPIGTVEGPPDAARRLVATIAAQVAARLTVDTAAMRPAADAGGAGGPRLVVVDAILPGFGGLPLGQALDHLDHLDLPAAGPESLTLLVCPAPGPRGLARLAEVVERRPDLRVLLVGPHPGPRWRLVLDPLGRLSAPELGLHADAGPLERGVARALQRPRRARRNGARPAVATPVPGPPVPQPPAQPPPAQPPPVPAPPVQRPPAQPPSVRPAPQPMADVSALAEPGRAPVRHGTGPAATAASGDRPAIEAGAGSTGTAP